MLEDAFLELRSAPRRRVEFSARGRVAVDEPLDAAVDVVEEYRVGTGPAAPEPAEEGGDVEERETKPSQQEKTDPEILGEKGEAEEMETPPGEIEKKSATSF